MEQVINGLKYNTATETLVASSKDGAKHLYRTRNGRFFLHYEHPGQSSVAPYLSAIPVSWAKKEYGSMPRQFIPWEKESREYLPSAANRP